MLNPKQTYRQKLRPRTSPNAIGTAWLNGEGSQDVHQNDNRNLQLATSNQAVPAVNNTSQLKTTGQESALSKKPSNQMEAAKLKKPLGFHAFEEPAKQGEDTDKAKLYQGKRQAVEPVSGIHSTEWAAAVVPQTSFLLNLPIELRWMIWSYVIWAFRSHQEIEPHRHGKSFRDPKWREAGTETTAIITICRQLYLDIVAGGLIYKYQTFFFPGPVLARQFLWSIRPSHKNTIRSVHLALEMDNLQKPPAVGSLIAVRGLESLQHLKLTGRVFGGCHMGVTVQRTDGSSYEVYSLSDGEYSELKGCEYLTLITGLLSFELHISMIVDRAEQQLCPQTQNEIREFERGLQDIMVLKVQRKRLVD